MSEHGMPDASHHAVRSMSSGSRHRRGLSLLTVAALTAGSFALFAAPANGAVRAAAAGNSATLQVESPSVTLLKKGTQNFSTAKTNQKLKVGDTIQTDAGGLAQINYKDGSVTRLDSNTVFTLEGISDKTGARKVEGTVSAGQTWNRVQKLSGNDSFEQSGNNGATATTIGTAFVTKCSLPSGVAFQPVKTKKALKKLRKASSCQFTLVDGKLQLTSLGKTVGVNRGQQVSVSSTGQAGDAQTFAPDILFTDAWIVKNLQSDAAAGISEAQGTATAEDLKQARLEGSWPVNLTVASNNNFRNLGSVGRTYTFTGSCNGAVCTVTLTRQTANGSDVIPLTYNDGVYTGTDPDMGTQNCTLDNGQVVVPNGLRNSGTVSISVSTAVPDKGLWRATGLTGTVTETATQIAGAASQCLAGSATFNLSAAR